MEEKLLAIEEIHNKWTVSRQGIVYFIDKRQLPAKRAGKHYIIKEKDWLEFLESRKYLTDGRVKEIRLRNN